MEHLFYADSLQTAGYTVAVINYRWSTDAQWPAQAQDIELALGFLWNRLGSPVTALLGVSAGGHLAIMAALRGAPIARIVALCAAYDLPRLAIDGPGYPWASPTESPLIPLLGGLPGQVSEAFMATASPLQALPTAAPLPPTLALHGQEDPIVGIEQARRFAAAMGPAFHLVELEQAGHGGERFCKLLWSAAEDTAEERVLAFLAPMQVGPVVTPMRPTKKPHPGDFGVSKD